MTIRAMQRAVVLSVLAALAAASFVACGPSDKPTDSGAAEEAQQLAEEATDAVGDLEARTDDLAAELDRLDAGRRSLADKFDRIHGDLRDSISNLRASISEATSDAASAEDSAQAALGELESALKRLSVLENRFDYHLRNDH